MKTANDVREIDLIRQNRLMTENWYYAQMFCKRSDSIYSKCIRVIVFAATPTEAKEKAKAYLAKEGEVLSEGSEDITLYHKNYKVEAKKMMKLGLFV